MEQPYSVSDKAKLRPYRGASKTTNENIMNIGGL